MMNARRKPPEFEVVGEKHEEAGNFNERAKAFFRRRCQAELSNDDIREIVQNLMQLFNILEAAEVQEERECLGVPKSAGNPLREDNKYDRE